ncbi:transcriptional regulator PpsR [uncultured Rhodoblastus sp.]|uniref:transcriptional regulator PpsR n=1 Tax=uncultured Rhodoblastus sp. TaxID=543037 RepID=UPI0025E76A9B|nr:transcriptional regulator PpsR [uncultured Rhodoblastus sp.]
MIDRASAPAYRGGFSNATENFGAIDAEVAGALVAASADVSLVMDKDGLILDVAFSDADLAKAAYSGWLGRRWTEVVTSDTRPKIEDILREANASQPTRWRHINHPSTSGGADVPVRYCAMRVGNEARVVAVGRDLRVLAALQQRLADAQQDMEREYARIRDAEKRYRLLFQLSAEPVAIVDAATQRIVEVNPAAAELFGVDPRRIPGSSFSDLFEVRSRQAIQSFVAAARLAPRVDNVLVEIAAQGPRVLISGSLFRQDSAAHLLILFSRVEGAGAGALNEHDANLLQMIVAMPEAFVVVNSDLRVLSANAAFLDLAQVGVEAHARNEKIERWLGRPSVDVGILFANLRAHGAVRHFSTVMRGELGSTEDVEVAGAALPGEGEPCYGLAIRAAGWRAGRERLGGRELPRTVEHFIDLVGRVPLKNLVRETTDLIERLCIDAALQLTEDNRAAAAEMLGLSRQGFYAKLRRYGLGNLGDGDETAPEDET